MSATLAKRLGKHGGTIFRLLFDPAVPSPNNGGEQSIRQLVIGRRITQGSRSLMGRQWNARTWTVLDTCLKQGRPAGNSFKTPCPPIISKVLLNCCYLKPEKA